MVGQWRVMLRESFVLLGLHGKAWAKNREIMDSKQTKANKVVHLWLG
jgi:hypothetical protein